MTPKIKSYILVSVLSTILVLMMFSCAQVGTISGGDKDTSAPYITKSKPENYSPNFKKKKVKIKFNEYYTLDKIEQTFLMNPPHDSLTPKIKVKGKWLLVKFKEPLKQDTTYTLQFFNSVRDFNEGNPINNFQFVFSTGPVVDSNAVSGHVYDANTLECEEGMLVGLYGEDTGFEDSCVIKYKPNYITRTDTAGYFKIDNVHEGRYKIFALKDINETMRFDLENEKIAFIDEILVTKAERIRKVDSLSAGTILHMGTKGHRYLDTLLTDSVIVQDLLYTTPNNISLFAFEEKHLVQYISERKRDLRVRFKLVFNKSVENDTVLITYVDDTLKSPEMIYDFNYTRDSLTVWLKDTADINNDTLQVRITFSTLDSLQNPTLETDTISVRFAPKKAVASKDKKDQKKTEGPDTGIDSLFFKIKSNFNGDFDIKKSISLQIPIVIDQMDTSLMKLYECVDSTFEEDLNQKRIKAVRLDSANYRLIFKRPILGDIVWYPTDSIVDKDWYRATYSTNRDTVDIEVLDSAMIRKSKFHNMLKYHNEYYLGEVQKIRDSMPTEIINQKIISYERTSRDSIKIHLEKAPTRGVEILPINIDKVRDGGIEVVQNYDKLVILLHDTTAQRKDTLALKFHSFDRMVHNKNHKVIEQTYKDTLFAIYKIKFQTLKARELQGSDTLRFVFSQKITDEPTVHLLDYPGKGTSWYTSQISSTRDTMLLISNDQDFLNLDTIRYAIAYPTFDNKENPIIQSDTLLIARPVIKQESENKAGGNRRRSNVGKESQKKQEEAKKNMAKAQLKFPLEYKLETDTLDDKNKVLTFDFEPGKNYMLEVDDSTFISIYNTPNLYQQFKAKIREEDYYGQINIDLKNIGNIEHYPDIDEDIPPFEEIDTSRTLRKRINAKDTMAVEYTQINNGQILVCLCNDKGDIKYMKQTKADGVVEFGYIVPGDYKIKLIHDRNLNNEWDTGKYLEHKYPERTIEYNKKQTVKSKWTTEVVWRL